MRDHLWFQRSNPNILSIVQVSKVFVAVKTGGGRGIYPFHINFDEFRSALGLLALFGSMSVLSQRPVVHVNGDSASSALEMVVEGGLLHYGSHRDHAPSPLHRLKWLFHRIYNSIVAKERKEAYLRSFQNAFGRQLRMDGAPMSYLMPSANESEDHSRVSQGVQVVDAPARDGDNVPSLGRHSSEWVRLVSESGQVYYFNQAKSEISLKAPKQLHQLVISPVKRMSFHKIPSQGDLGSAPSFGTAESSSKGLGISTRYSRAGTPAAEDGSAAGAYDDEALVKGLERFKSRMNVHRI